jgi:hypothetical protein
LGNREQQRQFACPLPHILLELLFCPLAPLLQPLARDNIADGRNHGGSGAVVGQKVIADFNNMLRSICTDNCSFKPGCDHRILKRSVIALLCLRTPVLLKDYREVFPEDGFWCITVEAKVSRVGGNHGSIGCRQDHCIGCSFLVG